jgi:uracil-DNA glycosylase
MEQQGQIALSRMIESLTGWWELAGADAAVGEMPVNWLELDAKADAIEIPAAPAPALKEMAAVTPAKPAIDWPLDIDTLKAMIAAGASLPGNNFGTRFVVPAGPSACDVMIISDLPDQDEVGTGLLGSGATGILLGRMLGAIGIKRTDCYWTALATTVPPTGSSACKALLNDELMKARAELRNINHDGSNMAVLTTFHPRTLIARPALKVQAWKDLQMFAKRADL